MTIRFEPTIDELCERISAIGSRPSFPNTIIADLRRFAEGQAAEIARLEARWQKHTEPGVEHPRQAPERIWVQWLPRLRNPVVYLTPPAILDGTRGAYVLDAALRGTGSKP